MFDSPDLHRVGNRRILACPYCDRLQHVIPPPVPFAVECRTCHRVFVVAHDGAVAIPIAAQADVRESEPTITPRQVPGQVFIDRQVEPADEVGEPVPPRSRADGSRGVLSRLRSAAIALIALAAAVGVAHAVVVIAESIHTAIRRAVEEGSMMTFDRMRE